MPANGTTGDVRLSTRAANGVFTRASSLAEVTSVLSRVFLWVFVSPWWGFLPAYLVFSWAPAPVPGRPLSFWIYGVALWLGARAVWLFALSVAAAADFVSPSSA